MAKTYSLYETATGMFTGQQLHCEEDELLTMRLPVGTMAIEGSFDPSRQRMESLTGTVVQYISPQDRKGLDRYAEVLARIQALEASQGRALREATLGDAAAMKRLQEIDAAIKALREELGAG